MLAVKNLLYLLNRHLSLFVLFLLTVKMSMEKSKSCIQKKGKLKEGQTYSELEKR